MRIAICGHGQSGKDTAAEYLRSHAGLRYTRSTSEAAALIVFEAMAGEYPDAQACFHDRRNRRKEWAEIIWRYNQPYGTTLYESMAATNDILNGIRCPDELAACRRAGLIDAAIWIDRPGFFDASQKFGPLDCDIVLMNHGTVAQYRKKLHCLAALLKRESVSVLVPPPQIPLTEAPVDACSDR
jgi:hypothetical protein